MSGVTDDSFRSSREIIPQQGDEPLRLEVVFPLISDQFLEDLWMRTGLLTDPLEFLIQKCPWMISRIHSRWSWTTQRSDRYWLDARSIRAWVMSDRVTYPTLQVDPLQQKGLNRQFQGKIEDYANVAFCTRKAWQAQPKIVIISQHLLNRFVG